MFQRQVADWFYMFKKIIIIGTLLLASSSWSKSLPQKKFNFEFKAEDLLSGNILYSARLYSSEKISEKFPMLADLDSLDILHQPGTKVFITKAVYTVDLPIGFFDGEQMSNQEYLDTILGEEKVRKIKDHTYAVSGPQGQYQMTVSYDSDDLSNLPTSKIVKAVTSVKRMDVISQSGAATIFREMYKSRGGFVSGVSALIHIPLKENKTLIINYEMTAIGTSLANKNQLKKQFVSETEHTKRLIESFRVK